ncbi:putative F-box protein At5g55150 [Coffea arabica]|uniref:F-box protein At5g55150 n=1 Tax=Coffea arabica TaxID=13443 RepID=A0A6P6U0F3_COFAR|nr:uncharacterized protein LOC113705906 [Coffea arabica]
MANWSDLQHDMLGLIAQHLDKIEDYVAFGAVCKSWRAAASEKNFKGLRLWQQIPCLMLAAKDDFNREFYSLMEKQVVAKVSLPQLKGKKCYESLGWLLTIGQQGEMSLLNPFSGVEIELPNQNTFPEYDVYETDPDIFVRKMVLSLRPSREAPEDDDFVVMIICGGVGFLAFWRPKDLRWNRIETRNSSYADVIYTDGQFYAIDHMGNVVVCDVLEANPTDQARIIARFSLELWYKKELYLVKSSSTDGEPFLVVTRDNIPNYEDEQGFELDKPIYGTTEFQVFELVSTTGGGKEITSRWKEVKNLGSRSIFLGHSSSMCLENNKLAHEIRPGHIYFTDDAWEGYLEIPEGGGKDMGVYNLEKGVTAPLYDAPLRFSRTCPSIWITPNF